MKTLEEMVKESKDVRELKRALGVKMVKVGVRPNQIAEILNVSEQFISKWKGKYEREGVQGLQLGYQGSRSFLSQDEKVQVVSWIENQAQISVEQLREHLEKAYDVIYRSKQSYYDLLQAGGMSYHRSTVANPKRDEAQVLEKREAIKKKWQNTRMKSSKAR